MPLLEKPRKTGKTAKKVFSGEVGLGYNLKQMQNIIIEHDNGMKETSYTTRHSLSVGLGLVF
jgi:hypothetical protein